MEGLIAGKIRATKRKLNDADWEEIAREQNSRFVGKTIKTGQSMASNNLSSKSKAGNASKMPPKFSLTRHIRWKYIRNTDQELIAGKRAIAKHDFDVPSRTPFAVRAMVRKWADTTTLINQLLEEVGCTY